MAPMGTCVGFISKTTILKTSYSVLIFIFNPHFAVAHIKQTHRACYNQIITCPMFVLCVQLQSEDLKKNKNRIRCFKNGSFTDV